MAPALGGHVFGGALTENGCRDMHYRMHPTHKKKVRQTCRAEQSREDFVPASLDLRWLHLTKDGATSRERGHP
jgi:hypothetical protein